MISGVNGSNSNIVNMPATSSQTTASDIGSEQAFLQLLITQLKNQDPTNPADPTQFVAELAQFSSLEQMTNMNSNIQSLEQMSVVGLIGKTATVADSSAPGGFVTGTINGITYYANGPAVNINGQDYAFSAVQNIQ
jgi:flagellar basal-body rod modification protein FlgD